MPMRRFMDRSKRKLIITIIIVVVAINLVDEAVHSILNGDWGILFGQILILSFIGWMVFRARHNYQAYRHIYKKRFEEGGGNVGVKDAALFSLTWSREIYANIPPDRRRLVKMVFILIGAASILVLLQVGFDELLPLLTYSLLVLAAINLLIWAVASERGEKEKLSVELETARQMQMSLMPKANPQFEGFDVAGVCRPAFDVGGDMYDFVFPQNDRTALAIAVADVAGKGMDAALTAVFASGAFVSETQHSKDAASIMTTLNKTICTRHNRSKFVSFLLAIIDRESRTIDVVNAGQSKPLLIRDGDVRTIDCDGVRFPLGVMNDAAYLAHSIAVQTGDVLLLFTDGITDAMNPAEEPFGAERLAQVIREMPLAPMSCSAILDALIDRVRAFTASRDQHDDLTMVVVKVN